MISSLDEVFNNAESFKVCQITNLVGHRQQGFWKHFGLRQFQREDTLQISTPSPALGTLEQPKLQYTDKKWTGLIGHTPFEPVLRHIGNF